jgi:hypothetical protein
MMVIVPTDFSLRKNIGNLKPTVPNPLLEDVELMRFIVTNHIIVRGGIVPKSIFAKGPEYEQIEKENLDGGKVYFHKEITDDGGNQDFK